MSYSQGHNAAKPGGLKLMLILGDLVAVTIAWGLGILWAPGGDASNGGPSRALFVAALAVCTLAMMGAGSLYQAWACASRVMETTRVLRAVSFTTLGAGVVAQWVNPLVPLAWVVGGGFGCAALVWIGRQLYRIKLQNARREGRYVRDVAIVGTSEEALKLFHQLRAQPELGFRPVGVIGDRHEAARLQFPVPWLAPLESSAALRVARSAGITGVAIAASGLDYAQYNHLIREFLDAGLHIQISGGLYGIATRRLRNSPIGRQAAFYLTPTTLAGWQAAVKRAMDMLLAALGITISAPIMIVLAIMVKRHDGGPILFRQQRVGRDNKPFTIYKLRTMVANAESLLPTLQDNNERNGPLFKMENDPRFTPVGRMMDVTSLNELPQLINVLKGDMSLVGPRPALPREVATFDANLNKRHRVRPGITGLWQVESRDSTSFSAYQGRDLYYVENWTVFLDVAILLATAKAVAERAKNLVSRRSGTLGSISDTRSDASDSRDTRRDTRVGRQQSRALEG